MRRVLTILLAMAGGAAVFGCGITGNLRLDPGFAAFRSPGVADTDRDLALSLGPLPLALARKLTAHDPEIAPLLRGVRAVRVYVYAIDGAAAPVLARLDATRTRLTDAGWDPVVAVRDDGERVAVLVRMLDDAIRGLAVMTQDGDQLVLVNVIGELRPENLSAAMAALDVSLPAMTVGADAADRAVRVAETR